MMFEVVEHRGMITEIRQEEARMLRQTLLPHGSVMGENIREKLTNIQTEQIHSPHFCAWDLALV